MKDLNTEKRFSLSETFLIAEPMKGHSIDCDFLTFILLMWRIW
jgi:hypothetical protein